MGDSADRAGLTGRAARGAAFIVGGRFIMRLFGFVNTIVLARLLAPEDFGLVAVGMTALQLLEGFSDIGVSQAVVRFRDAGRRDLDTLFTLSALRGAAISLLLAAAAPFAAQFYGDDRMAGVFFAVALYPLMSGLVNPRFYEFERDLDFSKEFLSVALIKFSGVATSIAIAFIWRSYWAIIVGFLVGGAMQLALSYLFRPHLPRLSLAAARKVLGFSGWLAGVGFVAALNNKLDAFILARVVGATNTGHYYVGFHLSELPTSELAHPMARAIYPGLSALQGDAARMRSAFLKGVEALGAVAMPAAIGFSFVARDLIPLLLGDKWLPAVHVVEVITPVLALQTALVATQFYAMAQGLTRLVFIREAVFFAIRFPLFVWAAIEYGLEGAIYAAAGAGLIHILLNLGVYARASGGPFWEPFWRARRSFAAVGAMAATLALADLSGLGPAARAGIEIVIGAAVYIGVHLALWRVEGAPAGVETQILDAARAGLSRLRRV